MKLYLDLPDRRAEVMRKYHMDGWHPDWFKLFPEPKRLTWRQKLKALLQCKAQQSC